MFFTPKERPHLPCKRLEQGFHSMRGFGAVILIALGKFLHRNCRAVVKEEANYAAQFGAPFYIEKWKIIQLQIAIHCARTLSANIYTIGAGELQSDPSHWRNEYYISAAFTKELLRFMFLPMIQALTH